MSLRAEIVRLGLRFFIKRRANPDPDLRAIRQEMERLKCLVPNPPRGTVATRVCADGVPSVKVSTRKSRDGYHVLYLHGGAYVSGSPSHYRDFIWRIADATQAHVLCISYRVAPEHPFPAAVDDAAAAYRWLLAQGADPKRISVMGDSAGGGLALALLLRLRDEGVLLPAAAVAMSPWTDLAMAGESYRRFAKADPMLSVVPAKTFARWYLAGGDARQPYASPLYGDPKGLPPTLIQVGSDEILLDDSTVMAARMRAAGCAAELEVWPRMPHVWQLYARVVPEARQAVQRIGDFVRRATAAPVPGG
jgi:acetyl esterase/lipase